MKSNSIGAIMGFVVGDALGVPFEFTSRESLSHNPVTSMQGYGTFNQPAGTWSDDTSMTLCLIKSLTKGFNYNDIFDKFLAWIEDGYLTPYGMSFGIGSSTKKAIIKYKLGVSPLKCGGNSYHDNGNGSLMRSLPIAFYTRNMDQNKRFELVHNISKLTHAHDLSLIACGIYVQLASKLLDGDNKMEAFESTIKISKAYYKDNQQLKHYNRLMDNNFTELSVNEIHSTGYVIDTLEAAIWCFLNTESYSECVLKAINLGGDTDTIGALSGGLAGLYYGYEAIPNQWLSTIVKSSEVEMLCKEFDSLVFN